MCVLVSGSHLKRKGVEMRAVVAPTRTSGIFCAVFVLLAFKFAICEEVSKDDSCKMENQEKIIPIHANPLKGKIKLKTASPTSATIEWKALEGGEEYRVFYIQQMMADKAATPGPVIKAPCAVPGSPLSATVQNLDENKPYNIYIRVERGGKYFAILEGLNVAAPR